MAITLVQQFYPIRRVLAGSDSVEATEGQAAQIRIGTTVILNERVPAGKVWRIFTTVRVEETDA